MYLLVPDKSKNKKNKKRLFGTLDFAPLQRTKQYGILKTKSLIRRKGEGDHTFSTPPGKSYLLYPDILAVPMCVQTYLYSIDTHIHIWKFGKRINWGFIWGCFKVTYSVTPHKDFFLNPFIIGA